MNMYQKIALAEKGWTVKKLAAVVECHPNYLSSVLSAKSKPFKSMKIRKKISKALGLPIAYLWPNDTN